MLSLGNSFLARSFLSSVIGHSFLYHLLLIPFQTRSGRFLVPFPASLEGLFLLLILRLLKVNLNQFFYFFKTIRKLESRACVRTGIAWCTCNIVLCFSLYINMYIVYDNSTNIVLPESIPDPYPDIWQSNPKLFLCPEDDLGGLMMLGRGFTSTRIMLCCVIYESEDGAINSSGSSVPAAAYPCIPHQPFFSYRDPPSSPALMTTGIVTAHDQLTDSTRA